jgi:hypothetical protein
MISILNFVFTILFYTTSRTKQAPTSISFEEFLNQKPFESNFQFLAAQKSFPILFPFFLSVLDHQYSFSYLFDPSHTLNHIFFTDPVNCSAQPCIRPTDPISFGHLQPRDDNRHLWPLRAAALLFTVSSAFGTVELPHLLPFFLNENGRTALLPLPCFHLL